MQVVADLQTRQAGNIQALCHFRTAHSLADTGCVRTASVPSCCDKSGTSCYHIVTRLMTVTDLLQVVPARLKTLFHFNRILKYHSIFFRSFVSRSLVPNARRTRKNAMMRYDISRKRL